MNPLDYMKVSYLIVHTAAHNDLCTVEDIRQWHLSRGFEDIGYHWVITGGVYSPTNSTYPPFTKKGPSCLYEGRSIEYQGSHAFGVNYKSFGVCLTGHGNIFGFAPEQLWTLFALYRTLKNKFPKLYMKGHNEIPIHFLRGCPGTRNNMYFIRNLYSHFTEEQGKFVYDRIQKEQETNPILIKLSQTDFD